MYDCERIRLRDEVESKISTLVSKRCRGSETLLRCRRKTGKRPKTWMLNSVRLKTELVDGRREASTVDAISAALVESDEGKGGARGWEDAGVALASAGAIVLGYGDRGMVGLCRLDKDLDGVRLR